LSPLILVAVGYGLGVVFGAAVSTGSPWVAGLTMVAVAVGLTAVVIGLRPPPASARWQASSASWVGWSRGTPVRSGIFGVALLAIGFGALNALEARSSGLGSLGRWVAAQAAIATGPASTGSGELSRWVTLSGSVVGDPEVRSGSLQYLVRVREVATARQTVKLEGLVLVRERVGGPGDTPNSASPALPRHGASVRLHGDLSLPRPPGNPGEFDYQAYLRRRGVAALLDVQQREAGRGPPIPTMTGLALACRQSLGDSVAKHLRPTEAALLQGIVFGGSRGLPPEVEKAFRDAGVFHILAVSGSNVAFVSGAVVWLARRLRLRPQRAALAAIAVVWFYALMTGMGASVVRASIMATVVLLGRTLGRPTSAASGLALSGLIILVRSPLEMADSGFQLSFLATAGLLGAAEDPGTPAARRSARRVGDRTMGRPHPAATALKATIGAQLALLPLTLHLFNQAPCLALVSNLAVVPLAGFLVVAGVVAALLGLITPSPLAAAVFLPCRLALWALTAIVTLAGRLPAAYFHAAIPPWWLDVAYYASLGWWYVSRRRVGPGPGIAGPPRTARSLAPGVLIAILALVLFLWPRLLPPSRLSVTFLDVGQGDCAAVRLPGGGCVLIDVGSRTSTGSAAGREASAPATIIDAGARTIVPYLHRIGVWRIDLLVVTHAHDDHSGGLAAVLDALPVGMVAMGRVPAGGTAFTCEGLDLARPRLAGRGPPIIALTAGEDIELAGGSVLRVLSPGSAALTGTHSDVNNSSVVLRLDCGPATFLFAGDLESEGEAALLSRPAGLGAGRAEPAAVIVLKVAHHGSQFSTSAEWLAAVAPSFAVISVGPNSFGHPSPRTEARLAAAGATVLRTDADGAITFTVDGRGLRVRTFRRGRTGR
jgi:competence protein ComEC